MIKVNLKNRIMATVVTSFALIFGGAAIAPHISGTQNPNCCYAREDTVDKLAIFVVNETNNEPLAVTLFTPDETQTETNVLSFNPQNFFVQKQGNTKILNETFKEKGADAALKFINSIFSTDIQKQVTFTVKQLAQIIDLIDGWEAEISKKDAIETNERLKYNIGSFKKCPPIEDFKGESKMVKLNGAQLLAYTSVNPNIVVDIFRKTKNQLVKFFKPQANTENKFDLGDLINFGKSIFLLKPIQ